MNLPLPDWLQAIVCASLYASLLALLVLAAQPLLRRYVPARWRMALWLLVLIRFAPLPLPESRWSLFNWLPHDRAIAAPAPAALPSSIPPLPPAPLVTSITPLAPPVGRASAVSTPDPPVTAPPPDPVQSSLSLWPRLLATTYLLGCAAMFAHLLLATRSLRRMLRRATPVTDPALTRLLDSARQTLRITRPIPLLLTTDLATPALVGFLHPRLLLPQTVPHRLTPDELRLVFLHECAHLRRHDVLLNYALALLSLAHWFNPLVWLLLPRLRAERELACDELVLLHTADPAPYGHTLLKLLESAAAAPATMPAPASVGIIESRSFFSRRIHMVATFRKPPRWLHITIATALIALGVTILTGPLTRPSPAQTAAGASATSPPAAPAAGVTTPDPIDVAMQHAKAQQTQRLESLAMVVKRQQAQVDTMELSLREFRTTHDLPAVLPTPSVAVAGLQQLTLDLDKAQANAANASAALESLKKQVQDGTPLRLTSDLQQYVDHGGPMLSLQTTRSQLEQDKAAARVANAANSPQMATIDARIATVDAQIADAREKLAGEARVMLLQRAETNANTAQVVFQSLRQQYDKQAAELRELDAAMAQYQDQADDLKTQRDLLQKLKLEYRQAQLGAMTDSSPQFTQVYDVRDLIGVPPAQSAPLTADQRAAADDLAKTISRVAATDKVSIFNGTLVISANQTVHEQVAQLLTQLRDRQRRHE